MLAGHESSQLQIRGLWGLAAIGALDPIADIQLLKHPDDAVRSWMIRTIGESPGKYPLERLAAGDSSAAVRLAIAAVCQRLEPQVAWRLLTDLTRHSDVNDPAVPLMTWFAMEPLVVTRRDETLTWLASAAGQSELGV
jgi:hypothetical protein